MPTRCNRGFYCKSYCLLNMFRAPLCLSSGAQEYYTVVAACGISCCGFQVAGLVWSWGLCVRFAGCCFTGSVLWRAWCGWLFLVYLSMSTCFGRICAHHQEKQLHLCDTWYLLFCVDDCLVCRVDNLHTRQSSTQTNKYQVSQKHSCFSCWWTHSRPKIVEIHKYTKNEFCTKLILFTRLYRDARSTKHKTRI